MLNKAFIDLSALKSNARKVKGKLKSGVLMSAVVKADAYGHGAPMVANALNGICDSFSVALLEEGVELRLSGIDKEIHVLTPFFDQDLPRAIHYNLIATVESVEQVKKINAQSLMQNRITGVYVKFNTGMNRLGVSSMQELKAILECITLSENVKLKGMFSHFAAPDNKKLANFQQNKFLLANNLVKGYNNKAVCHMSASGGFLNGFYADMVRIGILLYGYKPFESDKVNLSPVMKVYAPVIHSRRLEKGESALYGVKIADSKKDIDIIRYGYADGLMRKECFGQFNNRCMDMTAVDGGGGKWYPVMTDADIVAKKYHTISYEVLTKAALRAEKIYLN